MYVPKPAYILQPLTHPQDEPLHISLFPPHESQELDMSFILNSSLDIFAIRTRANTLNQDLGLLQAIDERLAAYGWLTNTNIKFVIVVDMSGRPAPTASPDDKRKPPAIVGLRDAELKPAFRAVQTAYIQLMLNPFFTPEERTPLQVANTTGRPANITSRKFADELQRIGTAWYPGITSI
jgi:trafficking protein particle complex subunit 2